MDHVEMALRDYLKRCSGIGNKDNQRVLDDSLHPKSQTTRNFAKFCHSYSIKQPLLISYLSAFEI